MSHLKRTTEFGLIDWIRSRIEHRRSTLLGIGDDCALIDVGTNGRVLVTTDMLMDGRHFRLENQSAESIGYKAMAVNISDIAAMAGRPLASVVAVALPRSFKDTASLVASLHGGLTEAANAFEIDIVGGDTNAWDGPLVISVTLFGVPEGRGPVTRGGGKPGDAVYVTGPLGGSLLGRHLRPSPRILEAIALNQDAEIHAMIDLSDGLASDLGHILDESGRLGAILDESAIPIHPDAIEASRRDQRSPLIHALTDGEDFELCFTAGSEDDTRWQSSSPFPFPIVRIGRLTSEPGLRLQRLDGTLEPIQVKGFDHLAGSP